MKWQWKLVCANTRDEYRVDECAKWTNIHPLAYPARHECRLLSRMQPPESAIPIYEVAIVATFSNLNGHFSNSAIACRVQGTSFREVFGIALECYQQPRRERGIDYAYNGYGGNSSSSDSLSSSSLSHAEEISIAVWQHLTSSGA